MERVLYNGPDDQVNHELAAETDGPLKLEHGKTYEVNSELADRLCASSQHFQRVAAAVPTKDELIARGRALGIARPEKLNKQALIAAIAEAEAAATAQAEAAEAAADSGGITDAEDEVTTNA